MFHSSDLTVSASTKTDDGLSLIYQSLVLSVSQHLLGDQRSVSQSGLTKQARTDEKLEPVEKVKVQLTGARDSINTIIQALETPIPAMPSLKIIERFYKFYISYSKYNEFI